MKYRNIFFDLDGTITDSGRVIMECAQYALDHFGYEHETEEDLRRFVGPSLMDSFQHLYGFSKDDAAEATRLFRSVYEGGKMYDVTVYPGIEELLKSCNDNGQKCFVITSKVQDYAIKIMKKIELYNYFYAIVGPAPDDPASNKERLISRALTDYSLNRNECIMIGDTHFDIDGAHKAGIDSIAVKYGYGDPESIKKAKPTYVASTPHDIAALLH